MLTECWHSVARAIHNVQFLIVHSFVISASSIVGSVQGFKLVSPPEGASYDSRDGLALRIPFSHNGSGAGAPASVSESLGEESSGESLREFSALALRSISTSFAAAASACANGVGVRLCGLEVRIRVRKARGADRRYLFVRFVAL